MTNHDVNVGYLAYLNAFASAELARMAPGSVTPHGAVAPHGTRTPHGALVPQEAESFAEAFGRALGVGVSVAPMSRGSFRSQLRQALRSEASDKAEEARRSSPAAAVLHANQRLEEAMANSRSAAEVVAIEAKILTLNANTQNLQREAWRACTEERLATERSQAKDAAERFSVSLQSAVLSYLHDVGPAKLSVLADVTKLNADVLRVMLNDDPRVQSQSFGMARDDTYMLADALPKPKPKDASR